MNVRIKGRISKQAQAMGTTRGPVNKAKAKAHANKVLEYENPSDHTAIEMTGTDRPGLFSEISAALADLHCHIVEAHAWTHNTRLACVAYISDQSTRTPIQDPHRLASIEHHLTTVLRATASSTSTSSSSLRSNNSKANHGNKELQNKGLLAGGVDQGTVTNVERRLHQLMLSVRDFDGPLMRTPLGLGSDHQEEARKTTTVWIESCEEKGYSVVSIECKDRRRLMFDTVCTLTDMQYVIFHASTYSHDAYAFQVYVYIHNIYIFALSQNGTHNYINK